MRLRFAASVVTLGCIASLSCGPSLDGVVGEHDLSHVSISGPSVPGMSAMTTGHVTVRAEGRGLVLEIETAAAGSVPELSCSVETDTPVERATSDGSRVVLFSSGPTPTQFCTLFGAPVEVLLVGGTVTHSRFEFSVTFSSGLLISANTQ